MRTLRDQVVVITGASSGIGRETARDLAGHGARVVLAARDREGLEIVAREIRAAGGEAEVVVTDVARWEEVQHLGERAVERFGTIDVWINNAGELLVATVADSTPEEIERILRVDLLGAIFGMKVALAYFHAQRHGHIVNVGSVESRHGMPYQSAYAAAKHGLKGFTDVLRLELRHENLPIQVSLVLPSSIATPIYRHARSKIGEEPAAVPPVYPRAKVAAAIRGLIAKPRREVIVGGTGKIVALLERLSPALLDRLLLWNGYAFRSQRSAKADNGGDNLSRPMPDAA